MAPFGGWREGRGSKLHTQRTRRRCERRYEGNSTGMTLLSYEQVMIGLPRAVVQNWTPVKIWSSYGVVDNSST